MSGSLAPLMLRIAAAVDGDGGAGVRSALQAALLDKAPFDAGELVYARIPGEHASFLLGEAREPFLGSDLVEHVLAEGAPFRIDDWRDAAAFPDTLARLRRLGLRSVLVLPFRSAKPEGPRLRGALAVARRHGWAFVGASLHLLAPLASLAGLAFDQALRLSALGQAAPAFVAPRVPAVGPLPGPPEARPEPRPAEREEALAQAIAARAEAAGPREEADASRALRSSLEAAEGARLQTERSRDDWAQQAASLRTRNEDQTAEIRELKRGLAGARETAAAAAQLAEAHEVRIRELEAELQHMGQERDRALREADEARRAPPSLPVLADAESSVTAAATAGPASEPILPVQGPGRRRHRRGRPA